MDLPHQTQSCTERVPLIGTGRPIIRKTRWLFFDPPLPPFFRFFTSPRLVLCILLSPCLSIWTGIPPRFVSPRAREGWTSPTHTMAIILHGMLTLVRSRARGRGAPPHLPLAG